MLTRMAVRSLILPLILSLCASALTMSQPLPNGPIQAELTKQLWDITVQTSATEETAALVNQAWSSERQRGEDIKLKRTLVPYQHDGANMSGVLVYPEERQGKIPGVLVAHTAAGTMDDFFLYCLDRVARMGYVAFGADVYAQGSSISMFDAVEARSARRALHDRGVIQGRIKAAHDVLTTGLPDRLVDTSRIAALGFCFGGLCVLDLARMGTDLKATITVHGILKPPPPQLNPAGEIRGRVLVLTGQADPMVPPKALAEFEAEMRDRHADHEIHSFPGVLHAFTRPEKVDEEERRKGLAFDEQASNESWVAIADLLGEVFTQP
ncbi:unnamed protein product [Chrysoparadoxa australica]